MKIGLTLSGGGFRATVFHLGVLARLAVENRLEEIALLSTVSGGSLCGGLVFAKSNFTWPSSRDFIGKVIPQARQVLTTQDLQLGLFWRALQSLHVLEPRANDLSALLKEHWGITARLRELPQEPRWLINATCYETAKNWRFERDRIGDSVFGYSNAPDLPVSDAVAASSGFPGLIGSLVFNPRSFKWFKYVDRSIDPNELASPELQLTTATESIKPAFKTLHLWDGGVYDNLGLEGVMDFVDGWRKNVEFLIVSDANASARPETFQPGANAMLRIIVDIMMGQVLSLRSRAVLERIINHRERGVVLQIGDTCAHVLATAGRQNDIAQLSAQCMSAAEAQLAADTPTMIRRLSSDEFERLFHHGFEVANYTLFAYYPDQFKFMAYDESRWV